MKKITYILSLFFLILFGFTEGNVTETNQSKEIKTLVLIIASDGTQAYLELQKVWKAYMNLDPDHFEVYFIRGDPNISLPQIRENDLIVKAEENYTPGILVKTVLSIEALLPRLNEFDFVVRTNLSSFYVFPRLLNFLKTLPKTNCASGVILGFRPEWGFDDSYKKFISGAGIIMSTDLARMMVDEKETLFKDSAEIADDVVIGHFFQNKHVPFISAGRRDFPDRLTWYYDKKTIKEHDFHFRAKSNFSQRSFAEGYFDELFINRQLLKMFYPMVDDPFEIKGFSNYGDLDETKFAQNQTIFLGAVIKNNDKLIPSFLKTIEHLQYDKKLIHLEISDCNSSFLIKENLKKWIEENESNYAQITYIDHTSCMQSAYSSELLGEIKNNFLNQTKIHKCDFCLIVDSETFLATGTLAHLLEKNKPVISPLLKPLPYAAANFRNFYVRATEQGYYKEHPDYFPITYGQKIGVFKVECVQSVYLIKADYIDKLTFKDGLNDLEFLSFCRSANKNHIEQYICNETEFGYFIHHDRALSPIEEKAFNFLSDDFDFYEFLFDHRDKFYP